MRRRSACWIAVLVMAAGCPRPESTIDSRRDAAPPERSEGTGRDPRSLAIPSRLAEAATQAELGDLALYLRLRAAAAADDPGDATALAGTLAERFPGSIWSGRAELDVA